MFIVTATFENEPLSSISRQKVQAITALGLQPWWISEMLQFWPKLCGLDY